MAMTSTSPGGVAGAADLLETIVAATRHSVESRRRAMPLERLEREAVRRPDGQAFRDALTGSPAPRIIAECKRRSPSRGILRRDYAPAAHAAAYARGGAAAISVLTEPTFFDGCLDHLAQVRSAVAIPVLRKDFIVSEYQLVEAARYGADAVLLIVGALDDRELRALSIRRRRAGAGDPRRSARFGRACESRRRGSGHHRRQQPQPSDAVGRSRRARADWRVAAERCQSRSPKAASARPTTLPACRPSGIRHFSSASG